MDRTCGTNRRGFPRYRLSTECNVTVAGEKLSATVTDFSLSGMGIFIKDLNRIENPVITIHSSSLELSSQALIVWTENLFSGIRCGLQCLGRTAGNLRHYRFPDILIGLKKSGKTGVLQIDHGNTVRRLFFRQGDVIFASSNLDQERMGDMLLDIGKISRSQFDESVEMMRKTGKRQGTVLVELGHLSPSELVWSVQYQVEKIIHNLFGLDEGSFIFRDEPLPLNEVITLQLSIGNLIYNGSKLMGDSEMMIRTLPPAGSVLCVSPDENDLDLMNFLDDKDRTILSLIDGNVTVQDILSLSPLPEQETLKIMFALFSARVIDMNAKGIPQEVASAGEQPEEQGHAEDPAFAEKIEELYRKQKHLDNFGILEVSWDAPPEEIKKAYHKMVRKYHPDRHANIRSEALRQKLNTIFAHINEAYRVISQARDGRPVMPPQQQHAPEKVDNRDLAKIRFHEGIISFKGRQFEQASILFGQAIYLDSTVPEYHFYYGRVLLLKKKIKDAEESIKKAVQLAPRNADFIAELGHIYLQLGFKTRARNTFQKALQINPRHERAATGLAQITPR